MCVVPKAANDMMQVGRLQGFDVSIHVPLTDVFPYDSFPVLVLLNVLFLCFVNELKHVAL